MSDVVRVVAVGAVTLSYGLGGALSVAVLGALTEPMHKPVAQVASRVWAWVVSSLLGALWAVCWRAWVVGLLLRDVAVTFLHTYQADRVTGRHYRGRGRRFAPAGRHRLA